MRKANARPLCLLLCAAVLACRPSRESTTPKRNVRTVVIPEDASRKNEHEKLPIEATLIDQTLLGTELGPDGAVAKENLTVTEGQPVYVTLRLHDSPVGLRTGTVWLDPHGKRIGVEVKEMKGSKVATFAMLQKLAPGHYRVQTYWGATAAYNKRFEVVPRKK